MFHRAVLASVGIWLPGLAGSKNFESEFILDLDAYQKRKRIKVLKLPPVVRHLQLAESFRIKLEAGEVPTRAALARQYGLTRARVTQLMRLLLLHPNILEYVRNLSPGTPERLVTEKKLRALAKQPHADQLVAAARRVAGFAAWQAIASSNAA